MLVISYEGKSRELEGIKRVILEIRGLSTDEKPVGTLKNQYIDNGSVFIEIDTGYVYLYDLDSNTWYNVTTGSTPTSDSEETEEPQEPQEPGSEEPEENVGE